MAQATAKNGTELLIEVDLKEFLKGSKPLVIPVEAIDKDSGKRFIFASESARSGWELVVTLQRRY